MLGKNEKFGVVIAVSKAYDSATSFVYAREVDGNEFGGSGKPFQLSRRSNDFSKHEWDNDILTDEKIGLGTILKYEKLGEEYLYTENTKFRPQVSTGEESEGTDEEVLGRLQNLEWFKYANCNTTTLNKSKGVLNASGP